MIIPIRCWTCGKILADKYITYKEKVVKYKQDKGEDETEDTIININNVKKTSEGRALDELNLKRYCCRNVMLSHVDLIDVI